MADKKISALTSLSPVDDDDLIVVVDVSDTTMASSGTTKKAIKSELKGDKGDDGVDGASIIDAEFSGDDIRLIKDDNTDVILKDAKIELKGEKGDAGVGAEVVTSFGTPTSDEKVPSEKLTKDSLDAKQETLVSGTNIKTINSTSILGSGDITISSPSKATGAELDTGTDDTKFATAKALADSNYEKNPMTAAGDIIYGGASGVPTRLGKGTAGQVLTMNGDATAPEWANASSGGTSLWTAIAGTRASNTTIKVSGDQTAIFKKGMIVRWKESGVDKVAYVSIPSTYSSPDTTITICGNTCASIDSGTFKYSSILDIEQFARQFAYAGTVGATGTDVMNAYYAPEPMLVLGAEIYVGTAASTSGNTVVDINKNGTTMFTTKPTIAYNALTVATPFAADSGASLALNDRVSIDIDTVTSTTFPVDLYVSLKIFPSRFLTLN